MNSPVHPFKPTGTGTSCRASLGNLRGGFLVEVISGSLGMGGGCKNGAVVVREDSSQVAI